MRKIQLLDSSLYEDKKTLKKLSYWFKLMNKPNGWHYDLDHLWILKELKKHKIKPGDTILDAGAGQGILQYFLCSKGYNVISLDFSPRLIPEKTKGIFKIHGDGNSKINYSHDYMEVISYGDGFNGGTLQKRSVLEKLKKFELIKAPQYIIRTLNQIRSNVLCFYQKTFKSNKNFGSIKYIRAPFHEIPIDSNSIDAVVSVSAIEHSDIELFDKNLSELLRILIPKAPLLISTSASTEKENFFHIKSSGWCFSLNFLQKHIKPESIQFDVSKTEKSLLNSKLFYDRLDPYYYKDPDAFCFKKKINFFPYLPIGLNVTK